MKRLVHISWLIMALLLLSACERNARTDNPKSYNNAGIEFEYPGNWKVTEDSQQAGFRYLSVETPGDAIVIIQIYPTKDALEINEFAQWFAQAFKEEIPFGTISASKFSQVKKLEGYENLTEQFSIILLGEDIPHTRIYIRKPIDNRVCLMVAQAADEDHSKVIRGFEQVFTSFRSKAP